MSRRVSSCRCKTNIVLCEGSIDFIIFYKNEGKFDLVGYNDSDYAGDLDDQRSTFGVCFHVKFRGCIMVIKETTTCYSVNN